MSLKICMNCKFINYKGACPIKKAYKDMTGSNPETFSCAYFKPQKD